MWSDYVASVSAKSTTGTLRICGRSILLLLALIFSGADAFARQPLELGSTDSPAAPITSSHLLWSSSIDGSSIPDNLDAAPTLYVSAPEPLRVPGRADANSIDPLLRGVGKGPLPPAPQFDLKRTLRQEFEYLTVEHGFRLMQDPALRSQLIHSRFVHNWFVSFDGYDLKRWSDGDNFLVSYIAHPMQGAIAGWIFIQNSPAANSQILGKNRQYWMSRLKAMGWAAGYEVQWKIGPLSETSIGNAGGWEYVPECGFEPKCLNNPRFAAPTNNTGLSDWIVTPTLGVGWIVMEDAIDKYIVGRVGYNNPVAGAILRTALEPTRNFAALFNGVLPWNKRYGDRQFMHPSLRSGSVSTGEDSWKSKRNSFGLNFVNISLPEGGSDCVNCRRNHPGIGFLYDFRPLEHLYIDSELNWLVGNGGSDPRLEGLLGAKFGHQEKKWGLFAKLRPGAIYYTNAWSGGPDPHRTDLARFVLDTGAAVELYPNQRSTFRIDIGSTWVRYLQDYSNPHISPLGRIISTDYYVTQGNFQISTGYRIRF